MKVFNYLSLRKKENINKIYQRVLSNIFLEESMDITLNNLSKQFKIPKSWVAFILFGDINPQNVIKNWRLKNE